MLQNKNWRKQKCNMVLVLDNTWMIQRHITLLGFFGRHSKLLLGSRAYICHSQWTKKIGAWWVDPRINACKHHKATSGRSSTHHKYGLDRFISADICSGVAKRRLPKDQYMVSHSLPHITAGPEVADSLAVHGIRTSLISPAD